MTYLDILNEEWTSSFKRDAKHISSCLEETKDGRLVALKPLDIMFPMEYYNKKLAVFGRQIHVVGVFAIIDPTTKKYAVMSFPAMTNLVIAELNEINYKDIGYQVISYDKHDTILPQMECMVDHNMDYHLFNYFIELGKVTWYMSFIDVTKLASTSYHYIGQFLGLNDTIVEAMYSTIARDPTDEKRFLRHRFKSQEDLMKLTPSWVALRNVSLGSIDTTSKIMGAYFDEGLTSAIAEPSKRLTEVEKVLRS